MKATTPERLYTEDLDTLNYWKYVFELPSIAAVVHKWINEVTLGNKRELYDSLPSRITKQPRPLSGCKIDKSRLCIQKLST